MLHTYMVYIKHSPDGFQSGSLYFLAKAATYRCVQI